MILKDDQIKELETLKSVREQVEPQLLRIQREFEAALFRAKKPIIDAIHNCENVNIPRIRIAQEGMDISYTKKMDSWMSPPEHLAETESGMVTDPGSDVVVSPPVRTVIRNPKTGVITVTFEGNEYSIPAIGPDHLPWASLDESIPNSVYDMVKETYPGFEVLDDEDEE